MQTVIWLKPTEAKCIPLARSTCSQQTHCARRWVGGADKGRPVADFSLGTYWDDGDCGQFIHIRDAVAPVATPTVHQPVRGLAWCAA